MRVEGSDGADTERLQRMKLDELLGIVGPGEIPKGRFRDPLGG